MTNHFPFSQTQPPFTIDYRVNFCGRLIKNTQEVTINQPSFPPNYGRAACAWQYTTIENAPIAVSEFEIDGEAQMVSFEIFIPDIWKLCKSGLCNRLHQHLSEFCPTGCWQAKVLRFEQFSLHSTSQCQCSVHRISHVKSQSKRTIRTQYQSQLQCLRWCCRTSHLRIYESNKRFAISQ